MMPQPDLPRTPEPGHHKAIGPFLRTILTENPGPVAGAGKAAPLADAGTPNIATAKAHQLIAPTSHPTNLPSKTDAAQTPTTWTALSSPQQPCTVTTIPKEGTLLTDRAQIARLYSTLPYSSSQSREGSQSWWRLTLELWPIPSLK